MPCEGPRIQRLVGGAKNHKGWWLSVGMGCTSKDLAVSERVRLPDGRQRVGIDAFLTAFQFLTTMRDRSPEGTGCRFGARRTTWPPDGILQRTCALLEHRIVPVLRL